MAPPTMLTDNAGTPIPGSDATGTLTIAEVAERTGVTDHTLRYYERVGLLAVGRDHNGRRRYTDADIGRVVFISRLRMSEMPIRDISRYVELVREGPRTEPQRLALLEAHRASVRGRIAELQDALGVVEYKITVYGGTCGTVNP